MMFVVPKDGKAQEHGAREGDAHSKGGGEPGQGAERGQRGGEGEAAVHDAPWMSRWQAAAIAQAA